MAETNARQRRAAARAERRAASPSPENEHDDGEASHHEAVDALRTAASAAIAGAAVGAAQALARRRHGDSSDDGRDPEADLRDERDEADDADESDDEQPTAPEEEIATTEREQERVEPSAPPMSADDTRRTVEEARRRLRDLRGVDAESVSSVRRTSDGWCVGLEVVEVRRIPESTDVLATYEVELDDDGGLIAFERTARYHRSGAERG
jgi:Gas vesicle synthesis protein GvpO